MWWRRYSHPRMRRSGNSLKRVSLLKTKIQTLDRSLVSYPGIPRLAFQGAALMSVQRVHSRNTVRPNVQETSANPLEEK